MKNSISSITIENFRCIRGSISIQLDAPVVLIYGRNGTGKTSILSALELSLTGRIPSLARLDDNYISHLVHKETKQGRIVTEMWDGNGGSKSSEWTLSLSRASGESLLSRSHARFFSERCYLAQSALGRLLEIYEHRTSSRSDSPLTIFVKELLGLDYLDSLVDGLHFAGDIRRLRIAVPIYWDAKEDIPKLERVIADIVNSVKTLDGQLLDVNAALAGCLKSLGIPYEGISTDNELGPKVDGDRELEELKRLASTRIMIAATRDEWRGIAESLKSSNLRDLVRHFNQASASVQNWKNSTGVALNGVLSRMEKVFSDLPSYEIVGPENARIAALEAVEEELRRCDAVLSRHSNDVSVGTKLNEEIGDIRLELEELDIEIGHYTANENSLAELLTSILQHMNSNDCPVCGRDFREIASESLESHVSQRIAALTKYAEQLRLLVGQRAEKLGALDDARRKLEGTMGRKLSDDGFSELNTMRAQLREMRTTLADMESEVLFGQQLIGQEKEANRQLSEFRSRNQRAMAIRDGTTKVAAELDMLAAPEGEDLEGSLERFLDAVSEKEERLRKTQSMRERATQLLQQRQELVNRRAEKSKESAQIITQLQRLRVGKERADERIAQARELVRSVNEAKADIVRRVFDDSLNSIWRDVFVRLAPDEPFVPAFAVPQGQTRSVEAVLETLYRSGGRGGNPRAMLSSGNLNTAALTLFVALHLSVNPTVPLLVFDDPVQSMDEVHVSQFVALLRTLSKQHCRQVIISVHEKPLFDYLSLELSPAFEGDRLITVEIENAGPGDTLLKCDTLTWIPDPAIAA